MLSPIEECTHSFLFWNCLILLLHLLLRSVIYFIVSFFLSSLWFIRLWGVVFFFCSYCSLLLISTSYFSVPSSCPLMFTHTGTALPVNTALRRSAFWQKFVTFLHFSTMHHLACYVWNLQSHLSPVLFPDVNSLLAYAPVLHSCLTYHSHFLQPQLEASPQSLLTIDSTHLRFLLFSVCFLFSWNAS